MSSVDMPSQLVLRPGDTLIVFYRDKASPVELQRYKAALKEKLPAGIANVIVLGNVAGVWAYRPDHEVSPASGVTMEQLYDAYYSMPAQARQRSEWVMSQADMLRIARMSGWKGDEKYPPKAGTLFGRPARVDDAAPSPYLVESEAER